MSRWLTLTLALALLFALPALGEEIDAYAPVRSLYLAGLAGDEAVLEREDFNFSAYICPLEAGVDPFEGIGFTYMDVDDDGSLELLIGETEALEPQGFLFDVWTLRGGEPVLAARGWERNRLYLAMSDPFHFGFYQEGADSAFVSIYERGFLSGEKAVFPLELIAETDAVTVWTLNGIPVSPQIALSLCAEWEAQITWPALTPVSAWR